MEFTLPLLLILVIPCFGIALHQSHHVDETSKFDFDAIHPLSQSSHCGADRVCLDDVGRGRGGFGFAQRSTGMCKLLELIALEVRILDHFGHSLNAMLIIH